ncbi:DUF3800 domain-containing protein [Pseudomonas chengduensis]|jgi:hypothetical protein|uniref:Uncharacterized protein n=1 Tax=Ectopseudomonas chengduensis TaxID=489632 RepID=A0A1G6WJ29_9GAMM|nr:DUF3800 domain-containing protein [Pseudomonas chengduensis]MBP3063826.1 DUF3800 domain-containing protein [Pseudomonas chengduensis]MDH0622488.1 DUF3800 domain-containing protein [Pseudomonas chengduensis]MDH1212668.1 DUF3800 domain-containing protein [Pseudomonas chengduensis]MDH1665800.1 DUF3800 domain-containing protein [Pseudomonas chengduensis]NNB77394.1 DUF3800 domain-containing protein [Pseudomonas chengduensis]|tara:strand:+ start:596 stop:1453 length:858 start_codon:yes stop_codon:yes gene_type:complete
MHFFYLDESGDTGKNLNDKEQPIFVLAGLSVADKKWNNTKEQLDEITSRYFEGNPPENFELHSHQLLSPKGEGPFTGHPIERRLALVTDLIDLIDDLGHQIHYYAIDKNKMAAEDCQFETIFDPKTPYLLAFEYLITYMNWHVKENLGQSARGMIVLDEKEEHHESIESIIHNRRYKVANNQKVKWIVEFSYPVDSRKNPMIQLSDLVALCIRRFLEIETGYKPNIPDIVKQFYGECFHKIDKRVKSKNIIERNGRRLEHLNTYISGVQSKPSTQWRRAYGLKRG